MPPRQALQVHPVALDLAWNDPEANLRQMEGAIHSRISPGGVPEEQLFLFPELTLTGFVTKDPPVFELDHPLVKRLSDMARANRVAIAAGFPERSAPGGKPFNTLALFGPDGKLLVEYHKMHLFTWGKNPEAATYAPGEAGVTFVYRGWKLGFAVCFDIRFPPLFHEYAKAGVDLILVSSCWIGGPHKSYQYRTIASAHAILTQAYVAAVNRTGKDPFFEYEGAELVFSPYGEALEGRGVRLDPAELEGARKLVVRPSDRETYRTRPA